MTTQSYQGYPFIQPHVTDAPSIDAATASRWNNLPRRKVQPPTNVVYVDLPDEGGSQVVWRSDTSSTTKHEKTDFEDLDAAPVIYIDVQDSADSEVASPTSETEINSQCRDSPTRARKKSEDQAPVIYIDLPGSSNSEVTSPAEVEAEAEFVTETIFYDPFENRRIQQKEAETDSEASASPSPVRPAPARPAPARPTGLPLTNTTAYGLPGSSHGTASISYEATQFQDPPPDYNDINTPHTPYTPHTQLSQSTTADGGTISPTEPPRTIVIGPGTAQYGPPIHGPAAIGLPSRTRKEVFCQFCGLRVHTLVIWEAGVFTHAIAFLTLVIFLPLVYMVYCTKMFKYQNHYCPNCNKKIGYALPALCISTYDI